MSQFDFTQMIKKYPLLSSKDVSFLNDFFNRKDIQNVFQKWLSEQTTHKKNMTLPILILIVFAWLWYFYNDFFFILFSLLLFWFWIYGIVKFLYYLLNEKMSYKKNNLMIFSCKYKRFCFAEIYWKYR